VPVLFEPEKYPPKNEVLGAIMLYALHDMRHHSFLEQHTIRNMKRVSLPTKNWFFRISWATGCGIIRDEHSS
jgi:hypothetical protein